MSVPVKNFVLEQGEDMEINMVYTEGVPPAPVDLTAPGWAVRMDITAKSDNGMQHLYTLNSEPVDVNGDTDENVEVHMGADGLISITIPRHASVEGGPLEQRLGEIVYFDLFVRTDQDKQRKVMEGTIYLRSSFTRWA